MLAYANMLWHRNGGYEDEDADAITTNAKKREDSKVKNSNKPAASTASVATTAAAASASAAPVMTDRMQALEWYEKVVTAATDQLSSLRKEKGDTSGAAIVLRSIGADALWRLCVAHIHRTKLGLPPTPVGPCVAQAFSAAVRGSAEEGPFGSHPICRYYHTQLLYKCGDFLQTAAPSPAADDVGGAKNDEEAQEESDDATERRAQESYRSLLPDLIAAAGGELGPSQSVEDVEAALQRKKEEEAFGGEKDQSADSGSGGGDGKKRKEKPKKTKPKKNAAAATAAAAPPPKKGGGGLIYSYPAIRHAACCVGQMYLCGDGTRLSDDKERVEKGVGEDEDVSGRRWLMRGAASVDDPYDATELPLLSAEQKAEIARVFGGTEGGGMKEEKARNPPDPFALFAFASALEEMAADDEEPDPGLQSEITGYYELAAREGGHTQAGYALIRNAQQKDPNENASAAMAGYERLIRRFNADSLAAAAFMYAKGVGGVTIDLPKAVSYLRKAADEWSHNRSAHNLAGYYDYGWGGLPKDAFKATEYYLKAATPLLPFTEPYGDSAYELGIRYLQGFGVKDSTPDCKEAFRWLTEAAFVHGHPRAAYSLANAYRSEEAAEPFGGLTQHNPAMYQTLLFRAAERGSEEAMYDAGELCWNRMRKQPHDSCGSVPLRRGIRLRLTDCPN